MDYSHILTGMHGRVGLVRLNRLQAMNALNNAMLAELMDALVAFDSDEQVNAMVVAGDQRAFAAGADIKEMVDMSVQQMVEGDPTAVFGRIRELQKPVIAAVSGWALGGGCELALACDMIIASEGARFGLPEVTLGVIPGAGGTQRLPRAIGKVLAMEIILNNRILSAREALSFGLVNQVVPPERFLEEALELAAQIAARAPLAVRAAKRMITQAYERPLHDGMVEERQTFYQLFSSHDQKEGMQAFIEKRAAQWKGK